MIIYRNRASSILYEFIKSNIKNNRSVIIPANVCEIVPLTYLKLGFEITYVDISLKSLSADLNLVRDILNGKKDEDIVLHYVRSYGYISEEDNKELAIMKNAYKHLIIVDDKCLCIPNFNDKPRFSDLILYSTGYAKYIDLNGGAFGILNEKCKYLPQEIEYLENDLKTIKKTFQQCKLKNIKFDKTLAKLSWLKIEEIEDKCLYKENIILNLEKISDRKEKLNNIYTKELPKEIQISSDFNNWRFNVFVDKNDQLINKLFQKKLFASKHYQSLGDGYFSCRHFNNCKFVGKRIVNLFNDIYYDEERAQKTVKIINALLNQEG